MPYLPENQTHLYKTWQMSTQINSPQNSVSGSHLTPIACLHHRLKVEVSVLLLTTRCNTILAVWIGMKQNVIENTIDQWQSRLRECILADGEQFEKEN